MHPIQFNIAADGIVRHLLGSVESDRISPAAFCGKTGNRHSPGQNTLWTVRL